MALQQTDRRTETARKPPQEGRRAQPKQERELRSEAAQALEALLSGGSWAQLSPEGVLRLSHTVGNAALAEIAAMHAPGPERSGLPLPEGPLRTEPLAMSVGAPMLAAAPDFGSLSPMGSAAPAAV